VLRGYLVFAKLPVTDKMELWLVCLAFLLYQAQNRTEILRPLRCQMTGMFKAGMAPNLEDEH
jgi:hypothetical protein